MELVYGYLDRDVADWLRKNAPAPRHGQNYHQWLTSQYGLKKLVEHLWMLIGLAKACKNMHELRTKMAEIYGLQVVQVTMVVRFPETRSADAFFHGPRIGSPTSRKPRYGFRAIKCSVRISPSHT